MTQYSNPLTEDSPRHRSSITLPYVRDSLSVRTRELKSIFYKNKRKGEKIQKSPTATDASLVTQVDSAHDGPPEIAPFSWNTAPWNQAVIQISDKKRIQRQRNPMENWAAGMEQRIGRFKLRGEEAQGDESNLPIVEGRWVRRPPELWAVEEVKKQSFSSSLRRSVFI
jgi:hypothetical protein